MGLTKLCEPLKAEFSQAGNRKGRQTDVKIWDSKPGGFSVAETRRPHCKDTRADSAAKSGPQLTASETVGTPGLQPGEKEFCRELEGA